ncbi:integrin alpha FG-GAP repeat containing protein 1 [Nematocida parisii]|nr:integrin alpha FG-GAP repeat containing protein 1 [Nematocida parisii]
MRLWKRRDELVEFADPVSIASDFRTLAYITDMDKRKVEIVGTNKSRDRIIVVSKKKDVYEIETIATTTETIDYIASVDIIKNGIREYLVYSKGISGFNIFTVDARGRETPIGHSDSMPFLVSYEGLNPFLFTQLDGKTIFIDVIEGTSHSNKTPFGILRNNHSSGFIDVSGDGVADLVLDTVKNGRRIIEIWQMNESKYTLECSFEIRGDTGPFVFGDFTGTGSVDILYLSNGGLPSINIIPNRRLPYCTDLIRNNCLKKDSIMKSTDVFGYDSKDIIKYPVKDIYEFSLYTEDGPVFPSVLDINSNTYPDILTVARNKRDGLLKPMLFLNTNGSGFENEDVFEDCPGPAQSVSFYRQDKGIWTVLETKTINDQPSLYIYRNNSDISGYYLSIAANIQTPSLTAPAVGASHACRIAETGRVIVGFYPPQTGYTTLQSPVIMMGLGTTNVFVGSFHSRIPSNDYLPGHIQDKIVPNSELVVEATPDKQTLKTSLYLNTNAYWPLAIPIILSILFVLVIITAYFSLKTRKGTKHNMRRTRYDVAFRAL